MSTEPQSKPSPIIAYDPTMTTITFDGIPISGLAKGTRYKKFADGKHVIYVSALSPFVQEFKAGYKGMLVLKVHTGGDSFITRSIPVFMSDINFDELGLEVPILQILFKEF
jgi:hypothetical protein